MCSMKVHGSHFTEGFELHRCGGLATWVLNECRGCMDQIFSLRTVSEKQWEKKLPIHLIHRTRRYFRIGGLKRYLEGAGAV